MMWDFIMVFFTLFVVLIGVISTLGFIYQYKVAWDNRDGSCILTQSRGEIVQGLIHSVDKDLWGNGRIAYTLYYPGTYERSGEKCLFGIDVTELEYSRRMYKE